MIELPHHVRGLWFRVNQHVDSVHHIQIDNYNPHTGLLEGSEELLGLQRGIVYRRAHRYTGQRYHLGDDFYPRGGP